VGTSPPSGTQAVDRAALLLSTVVASTKPRSFTGLARECDLPRSTTSRLLAALERTDLLARDGDGNYGPGPVFWKYAARHDPALDIADASEPVLRQVSEATGETVNLGMARGDRVVHVAQVDARFLLGTRDWTQLEVPPHASSLGKVLYAFGALAPAEEPLAPVTKTTIIDPVAFERHLDGVRRRGYATTVDELEPGLAAVAAPVRGIDDEVIAALGISGPTSRIIPQLSDHARLLEEHADQLSGLLRRTADHRTDKKGWA
jgi:IclR family transcriptional regulator, acetate operon repressor